MIKASYQAHHCIRVKTTWESARKVFVLEVSCQPYFPIYRINSCKPTMEWQISAWIWIQNCIPLSHGALFVNFLCSLSLVYRLVPTTSYVHELLTEELYYANVRVNLYRVQRKTNESRRNKHQYLCLLIDWQERLNWKTFGYNLCF